MNETQRIQLIDYLKAVCVIMVIITHYDWSEKSIPIFTMLINMAVPVFMILSGFNFAMSNQKKTDGRIRSMYRWELLKPKLIRFLFPFLIICIVEIILLAIEGKNINLFRIFAFGAYGPGSYYVPLLIQMLIIFPLIYALMERSNRLGLIVAATANLIYEIVVYESDMDKYYYRLCVGRYILLIAFGCYMYLNPKKKWKKRRLFPMFAFGLGYIILVLQMEKDPLIFQYWTPTAMPIAFYVFPIVVFIFHRFYHSQIPGRIGQGIAYIGKASYHIFLVQMVYYHFGLGESAVLPVAVTLLINISMCVAFGIGFFELENCILESISNKNKDKIKNKNRNNRFRWRGPYAVQRKST